MTIYDNTVEFVQALHDTKDMRRAGLLSGLKTPVGRCANRASIESGYP